MFFPRPPRTLVLDRKSIRKKGHDYGSPGYYFVTINTYEMWSTLGRVHAGKVELTPAGQIVHDCWLKITTFYPNMELDAFVVMPNHLHGIIRIVRKQEGRDLAQVLGSFKNVTSKAVNRMLGQKGSSIWHRNYYERILSNQTAIEEVRRYILQNPAAWEAKRAK